MDTCYIFGSVDITQAEIKLDASDYVIAADKGLLTVNKLNITPDLIIGDFDSLGYVPQGENVIKFPIMKDDTDLIIAIKEGLNRGYKLFKIYGCLGGERLDHTIAAIQTLGFISENDAVGILFDDNCYVTLLENKSLTLDESCEGIISVFSYSDKATVSISGLKYNLEKAELTNTYPIGVSNEFIHKNAVITSHNGKILVVGKIN